MHTVLFLVDTIHRESIKLRACATDVHECIYYIRTRAIPSYISSSAHRTVWLVFRHDKHVNEVVDYSSSYDRTGVRTLPCCHSAAIMTYISNVQAKRPHAVPTRSTIEFERSVYKRKTPDT